jgi:Putative beta-barrel porin-2, OmpL-like. bbp2
MKKILYLIGIVFGFAGAAAGQEADSTKGKFAFSGYVDSYYFTNFNNPSSRNSLGQSGVGRGFDRYVDQFQIGMVQTKMTYTNNKSEAVIDLTFGPNSDYGNFGNARGYQLLNTGFSAISIKQAYFKYNATDKLSFTLGQFGTHIGYEYIDAPLNFHYSINHTFNSGIPFYHSGLKAEYKFSDKVGLMLGVVNGSDMLNDNNRGKSIIGQLSIAPTDGVNIYLNYIGGNEANARVNGRDTTSLFSVYDLVATWKVTDKLLVGTWLMLGALQGEMQGSTYFEKTEHWGGANLYATYDFNSVFSLGFRGEYFDNSTGVRALQTFGKGTDVTTWTLTGNINLADGHLLLKPELRFDNFRKTPQAAGEVSQQQFMDSDGNYTKNSQTTFGMAAIYKF